MRIMRYPNVWQLFALKNLATIPLFLFLSIFQLHLINAFDVSPETNSMITMLIGVCITLANGFAVVALRAYFSESHLLLIGIVDLCFTFTSMIFFYRLWMVIIIMPGICHQNAIVSSLDLGMALGMSLVGIASDSQLTSFVPQFDHGTVLGMSHSLNALTRTLSPSIGGYLLEYFGFSSFGCIGVICSLIAVALWTIHSNSMRAIVKKDE